MYDTASKSQNFDSLHKSLSSCSQRLEQTGIFSSVVTHVRTTKLDSGEVRADVKVQIHEKGPLHLKMGSEWKQGDRVPCVHFDSTIRNILGLGDTLSFSHRFLPAMGVISELVCRKVNIMCLHFCICHFSSFFLLSKLTNCYSVVFYLDSSFEAL